MQWEDAIWSYKATPTGQYGWERTQKPLVDSCPAHGSASRKRTLRSGRTLISIYLFLISLFVFLFWDSGEKRKKKGEQSKRDTSLKETIYCIDITCVNKMTTQHIWAKRLRPHICLLMVSQVTRSLVAKLRRDTQRQSLFLLWYPSSQ